jgi:Flp pilus assembly pilin Flp
MNRIPRNHPRMAHQSGHAVVEYAVIASLLAACLFAAQSPAGQMLTKSIHDFYTYLTFFISLP